MAPETVMDYMHKKHISLNEDDMRIYGDHFRKVLDQMTVLMKEDVLFNALFSRICGAGSYYDGLKVGKPEEFDVDVVLRLPVNYKEIDVENNGVPPAFTRVNISKEINRLRQHPEWTSTYRGMDSWTDAKGYLLQSEFRKWIEGVVNKALNKLDKKEGNCYELIIPNPDTSGKKSEYTISLRKTGPAMTFNIIIPLSNGNVNVDVDFVPVIEFTHPKWPPKHVRILSVELIYAKRTSWFIVPKPQKKDNPDGTLWRLAFHEQEREMINGKRFLKPVCRLLKKLRDSCNLNIESYYLKTLFLWKIEENKDPEFWKMKQSHLFIHMLKFLQQKLKAGKIEYYWDKRYNLIGEFQEIHNQNLNNRLERIIVDIEKNVSEKPHIFAKYILPSVEYKALEENFSKGAVLTPAKPIAVSPSCSAAKEGDLVHGEGLKQKSQVQMTSCSACVTMSSKLDDIMSLLTALHVKVNTLETRISTIREDNASLREQLQLNKMTFSTPHELDMVMSNQAVQHGLKYDELLQ